VLAGLGGVEVNAEKLMIYQTLHGDRMFKVCRSSDEEFDRVVETGEFNPLPSLDVSVPLLYAALVSVERTFDFVLGRPHA
jgi:hypothetical protein